MYEEKKQMLLLSVPLMFNEFNYVAEFLTSNFVIVTRKGGKYSFGCVESYSTLGMIFLVSFFFCLINFHLPLLFDHVSGWCFIYNSLILWNYLLSVMNESVIYPFNLV